MSKRLEVQHDGSYRRGVSHGLVAALQMIRGSAMEERIGALLDIAEEMRVDHQMHLVYINDLLAAYRSCAKDDRRDHEAS